MRNLVNAIGDATMAMTKYGVLIYGAAHATGETASLPRVLVAGAIYTGFIMMEHATGRLETRYMIVKNNVENLKRENEELKGRLEALAEPA